MRRLTETEYTACIEAIFDGGENEREFKAGHPDEDMSRVEFELAMVDYLRIIPGEPTWSCSECGLTWGEHSTKYAGSIESDEELCRECYKARFEEKES